MRGAKYRALTAQQIKPEGWLLRPFPRIVYL